jgi:hypothetical protein
LRSVTSYARFSRLGRRRSRRSENLETLHRSYHPISGRPVSRAVDGSVRPTEAETSVGEPVRNPPRRRCSVRRRTLIVEQKRKLFLGPRARSRGFVLIRYRFVDLLPTYFLVQEYDPGSLSGQEDSSQRTDPLGVPPVRRGYPNPLGPTDLRTIAVSAKPFSTTVLKALA